MKKPMQTKQTPLRLPTAPLRTTSQKTAFTSMEKATLSGEPWKICTESLRGWATIAQSFLSPNENKVLSPPLATPCTPRTLNNYPSMYQEVWTGCYYQPARVVIVATVVHKDAER